MYNTGCDTGFKVRTARVSVRRFVLCMAATLVAQGLAGCSAISIPLGDLTGRGQHNETTTVSAVPVNPVSSQPLPPLPRPTAPADVDPITTGSIPKASAPPTNSPVAQASPDIAIPYNHTSQTLAQPSSSLASSGLASIPPAKAPSDLLPREDAPFVHAVLPNAFLDQESAATLPWLNQANGHGGLVVPVGSPVRQNASICRAVVISVQPKGQASDWLQANACKTSGGDWVLNDQRPWRNPA